MAFRENRMVVSSDESDDSDMGSSDIGSPKISLEQLEEANVRVRVVTVERPAESGVLLRSLGLSMSSTESSQISGAIITSVDNMSPASNTGQIYVGDLVVAINNHYLLGSSFGMTMMALAECGHALGSKITFKLASAADLKARGLFSPPVIPDSNSESDSDGEDTATIKTILESELSKHSDSNNVDMSVSDTHTENGKDEQVENAFVQMLSDRSQAIPSEPSREIPSEPTQQIPQVVTSVLPLPRVTVQKVHHEIELSSDSDSSEDDGVERVRIELSSDSSSDEDEMTKPCSTVSGLNESDRRPSLNSNSEAALSDAGTGLLSEIYSKNTSENVHIGTSVSLDVSIDAPQNTATENCDKKGKKKKRKKKSTQSRNLTREAVLQMATSGTTKHDTHEPKTPAPTNLGETNFVSPDTARLEKAKATGDELQKLAEHAAEAAAKAKASQQADEWRAMQAAVKKKLDDSFDLETDESDNELLDDMDDMIQMGTFDEFQSRPGSPIADVDPVPDSEPVLDKRYASPPTPQRKKDTLPACTPIQGWLPKIPLRFIQIERGSDGLGFQIQKGMRRSVRVVEVLQSSVAALAGLLVGDVIVRVGAVSVIGKTVQETGAAIVSLGTKVSLAVASSNDYDEFAPEDFEEYEDAHSNKPILSPNTAGEDAAANAKANLPKFEAHPANAAAVEALPEHELYMACEKELDIRYVKLIKCSSDQGLGLRLFSAAPTWACPNPRGIRIAMIFEGSPAARTNKLEVGDVVLEVNGTVAVDATHQDVVALIKAAQVSPPPGHFFQGQEAVVSDFVATPGDDGLERRFTNVPVTYVQRSDGDSPMHIVELESGAQLEVPGRCLIVSAEQLQISVVNLRVTSQAGFDSLVRKLERERNSLVIEKPKNTEEFSAREERRTIMAVLKQNLIMGAITQEEYDHMAEVNSASLGIEKEEVPLTDRLFTKGKSWLKKKLDIDLDLPSKKENSPSRLPSSPLSIPKPDEPLPPPLPSPVKGEPITPIKGRFQPLSEDVELDSSSSPVRQATPSKKKKPRRRKILDDEFAAVQDIPDPLQSLISGPRSSNKPKNEDSERQTYM